MPTRTTEAVLRLTRNWTRTPSVTEQGGIDIHDADGNLLSSIPPN